jgi:hypothetical protein
MSIWAILRAVAEQRRAGVQRLEIAADRQALRQHRAVAERERGRLAERIDGEIGLRAVLGLWDRDVRLGMRIPFCARKMRARRESGAGSALF